MMELPTEQRSSTPPVVLSSFRPPRPIAPARQMPALLPAVSMDSGPVAEISAQQREVTYRSNGVMEEESMA